MTSVERFSKCLRRPWPSGKFISFVWSLSATSENKYWSRAEQVYESPYAENQDESKFKKYRFNYLRRSPRRSTKCYHTEPICDFPHVYLYKKKSSISKFPTTNSAYRCVSFILFHSVCGFSYVHIQSKPHKYTSHSIDLNCLQIGTKDRYNNSEQAAIQEAETLQQLILNDTGNVCTIRSVHERTCQSVLMKEGEKLPQ